MGPNRLWLADITYVPNAAGFLFLDVSSRRIVGWAMATELRTRPVRDALDMAVFAFIEGFDNPTRRHSAQGCLSPIEHEARAMAEKG